jgi:hypothetical protein
VIVPTPPSKSRAVQPLFQIADEVGRLLSLPVDKTSVRKTKVTPELKNVDHAKRLELLGEAHSIQGEALRGQRVLLLDDLYQSGATLNAIASSKGSGGCLCGLCIGADPSSELTMEVVFLGGSRRIARLNESNWSTLDELLDRGLWMFIGDANGADRALQQHLADRGYERVVVYAVTGMLRNNAGHWKVRFVDAPRGARGFDLYSVKDTQMANDASYGFML